MRSATAASTLKVEMTCIQFDDLGSVSTTATPPSLPSEAKSRCDCGAIASPLGAALMAMVLMKLGVVAEMSTTSTPLAVWSARYRRFVVGSASTASNEPAAITGMAAVRTVDRQLVHPPRSSTPPAAATRGTNACPRAARSEPAGFIHTKRRGREKYGSARRPAAAGPPRGAPRQR